MIQQFRIAVIPFVADKGKQYLLLVDENLISHAEAEIREHSLRSRPS